MYYDKSVFSEDDVKNLDTMLEKERLLSLFQTAGISLLSMQLTDVHYSEKTVRMLMQELISPETRQ